MNKTLLIMLLCLGIVLSSFSSVYADDIAAKDQNECSAVSETPDQSALRGMKTIDELNTEDSVIINDDAETIDDNTTFQNNSSSADQEKTEFEADKAFAIESVGSGNLEELPEQGLSVPVIGIFSTMADIQLFVGEEVQLTAYVIPEDAQNQIIRWNSNNEQIVGVDETGKIIGYSEGQTTVTATTDEGGFTATGVVTVSRTIKEVTVEGVEDKKYTGKETKQNIIVKSISGANLIEGKDYLVSYKNSIGVGIASVIITGTGNYRESLEINYQVYYGAGWHKIGDEWYYFIMDRVMAVNTWTKDSGGWYWMDGSGKISRNKWIKSGNEWYYLKSDGYMAANEWAKDSGGWYWMGNDGRIAKSKWVYTEGVWYYTNQDGYMVTGQKVISGKTYRFDSSGKLMPDLVINTNSKKIHNADCSAVSRMSARNKATTNKAVAQLIREGYTICEKCKPHD